LRGSDALQEAQLVEVRWDTIRGHVGLLFDLRLSLQFRDSDTGLIVLRGVTEVAGLKPHPAASNSAWNVVSSQTALQSGTISVELGIWPEAQLRITALAGEFYELTVGHLNEMAPPDLDGDDAAISEGTPDWNSLAVVKACSSLRP
jgi:hypothetical protein